MPSKNKIGKVEYHEWLNREYWVLSQEFTEWTDVAQAKLTSKWAIDVNCDETLNVWTFHEIFVAGSLVDSIYE